MTSIPIRGKSYDDILKKMELSKVNDADHNTGRTWSLVYHHSPEHTRFIKDAHHLFFSENALNPMAFQSLKQFEHEVVQMTSNLLNGDDQTVGVMTSGGTESCLLPVLCCREKAKAKKRWGRLKPEMIVPESIHVAWDKAAKYFNVKIIKIPLTRDYVMDLDILKKKINRHTILLVASAPSYPHGVIDPISEIGRIALEKDIPFHVDACLGGFMLPFLEKIGTSLPCFDFRCSGVTSMSADVHKYGFGAKGASILLYKNIDYLKHQFFIQPDWPGGIFASPALLGTRPGGPIAAAWGAMNALGIEGYKQMAADVKQTTDLLISEISKIEGLQIIGDPQMSVFAFQSSTPKVNIFAVGDIMEQNGWHIDRLQRPDALHVMVTPAHKAIINSYVSDLKKAVNTVKENPGLAANGNAAMYGMISKIPFRGMVEKEVMKMMKKMYGPEGKMPLDESEKHPLAVRIGSRILNIFRT